MEKLLAEKMFYAALFRELVGYVTALSFKAAVDEPTRFKSLPTVGAHFGLTPRRF